MSSVNEVTTSNGGIDGHAVEKNPSTSAGGVEEVETLVIGAGPVSLCD